MKKHVKINLDRPRQMVLDLDALSAFEEKTGESVFLEGVWENPTVRKIRIILWASLLRDDPDLTFETAKNLVTMENLTMVVEKITEVMELSFPGAKKKPAQQNKVSL